MTFTALRIADSQNCTMNASARSALLGVLILVGYVLLCPLSGTVIQMTAVLGAIMTQSNNSASGK